MNVSIVIPTYNAQNDIDKCLINLIQSKLKPNILVVDSSSRDNTIEIVKKYNVDYIIIPQTEFNFGCIREKYRKYKNAEIFIALSQDAYATDTQFVESLISPLNNNIAVSYARQMSKNINNLFESIPRDFNYPPFSNVRCFNDLNKYGVYTFFCSNSAAAYKNDALDSIGGFPEVMLHEDHLAVAKLLQKGYCISYTANAKVYHSHDYSYKQEFSRYFDIGYVVSTNRWFMKLIKGNSQRGVGLALLMFKSILKQNPKSIFKYFGIIISKYLGYLFGLNHYLINDTLKQYFSGQKYFWDSRFYKKGVK